MYGNLKVMVKVIRWTGFIFRYLVPLGVNDQGQSVYLCDLGMYTVFVVHYTKYSVKIFFHAKKNILKFINRRTVYF